MPVLNQLAAKTYDGVKKYSDVVHFVHVYIVEPHPTFPDPSPYTGFVWANQFSGPQARTYDGRRSLAVDFSPNIKGNQLLLIDEVTPAARDNPMWCSYGPAPNPGFLISRDGTLRVVHEWIDVIAMEKAIDSLLGGEEDSPRQPGMR